MKGKQQINKHSSVILSSNEYLNKFKASVSDSTEQKDSSSKFCLKSSPYPAKNMKMSDY